MSDIYIKRPISIYTTYNKDKVGDIMSWFYGYLRGNRGDATRCGSKSSGIHAHIRSWHNDVTATLRADMDEKDELILTIPKGLKVYVNGKLRRFR